MIIILRGEAVGDFFGDMTREIKNRGGATVIFGEGDDVGVIMLAEGFEIGRGGALKFKNGLIVVADGHDLGAFVVGEEFDEFKLGGIGVLEFVEEDELKAFGEGEAETGVGFEGGDGFFNHVSEVEEVVVGEVGEVGLVNLGEGAELFLGDVDGEGVLGGVGDCEGFGIFGVLGALGVLRGVGRGDVLGGAGDGGVVADEGAVSPHGKGRK